MDPAIILTKDEFTELSKDAPIAKWLDEKEVIHFKAHKLEEAFGIVVINDMIPFATTALGRLFWGMYVEAQDKL